MAETLKKSKPKTTGAAIDVIASIQHETGTHPSSPFFLNLSKEVERTYEELRTRKIDTEEAVKQALDFSERISEWKREESEIGKDKYPLYEALKTVLPDLEKERVVTFVKHLKDRLNELSLLFDGWQQQRDVRRKIRAETRLLILSEFKDHRDKIDDLTDQVFGALEGTE